MAGGLLGSIDSTIKIKFEATGLEKFNKKMKSMNSAIGNQAQKFRTLSQKQKITRDNTRMNRVAQSGFFQTLRLGEKDWKAFNEQGRKMNTRLGRSAQSIRKMTQGMKGFRMELLGVMFFGMAMTRTLGGLIKTSLEWTGVTEILSTALGVLFLPIAEKILQWALIFLNFVLELTEAQKLWIGKIVLLGMALGGLLFVIGTLGLGVGALIAVFGALLSPMGLILAGLAAFAAIIAFDQLPSLLDNLGNKIDKNGPKLAAMGISGEAITQAMTKFREMLSGMLGVIEEKKPEIEASGRKIMDSLFTGIKTWLSENPLIVVGAMIGAWFGGPAGAAIGAGIGGLFAKLDLEKMDEVIQKGTEIANAIITGISENADAIASAMDKILTTIGNWVGENSDKLAEIGIKITAGIAKGFGKGFFGFFKGVGNEIAENVRENSQLSLTDKLRQSKGFPSGLLGPQIAEFGAPERAVEPGARGSRLQSITINQTNNFTGTDKQLWMSDIETALTNSTEDIRISS